MVNFILHLGVSFFYVFFTTLLDSSVYTKYYTLSFDTDESEGENLLKDHSPLPDEISITNEMYNALYDALATLSIEEQLLLLHLYVKEESLRSIAYRQHNNPMNISRKRDRLFKKLTTLLKKYKVS